MTSVSSWNTRGRIAVLTIDSPPVNALSAAVRDALIEGVTRAANDEAVDALVIACAGKTFFPGADIKEFERPPSEPLLPTVVQSLEASEKPVVAAIHGTCLGGGLEVAMACHYRIALGDARFGMPEVLLGIMPGARGTQNLPRLVGIEQALELCALGNPINAARAKAIGLVDEIATGDLMASACKLARAAVGKPVPRTGERPVSPVPDQIYAEFAKKHARRFRGLEAPQAIIDAVRASSLLTYEEAVRLERQSFLKLRAGPQAKALRYRFAAEREGSKLPGLDTVPPRQITHVGIVGSGTMGTGIALAFLMAGFPVTVYERDGQALESGINRIHDALSQNVASGRMNADNAQVIKERLTRTLALDALRTVDLVVEAAYEAMDVKRAIFSALDTVVRPGAILASNTSYLDIDLIAESSNRARDFVGLHFFSPANIMKLLEIVRGRETAPDVLVTAFTLARRLGKVPVLSGNAHGFIGNRMLAVRRREAERLALQGIDPARIDTIMEEFGFAMGPFRVSDLSGLDLGWSAEQSTGSTIKERLCEAGRRGRKVGQGYYDYDDAGAAHPSSEARRIIRELATAQDVPAEAFSDEQIRDRLLWPMVDEGAILLHEGIAQRESDIDVVWLNGYGWPAWTGGPMFHARATGLTTVCKKLEEMGSPPSEALASLAAAATEKAQ